jgi:hypothetical protein
MLCIPDSTTNTWIANQLYSHLGNSNLNSWIGYSDLPNNDGNYEWVSGCSSSYSNSGYSNYNSDCVYIQAYYGAWSSYSDSYRWSIACSCQSLPTLLPSTRSSDNTNASVIIGIVVGCVVFTIIVIFICRRTNPVCISTIIESPSNNNNISSSDQAYTDIPPICSSPDDDDDDDDDNDGDVISPSTIELQVIVASDAYYNDVVQVDHEQELLPVAVQV